MSDTFFQFPLCLLAYHADVRERLDSIISFGAVEAGATRRRKLSTAEARTKAKEIAARFKVKVAPSDERGMFAILGCDLIGITPGNLVAMLQRHRDASSFVASFKAKHGPQPLVKIRKDFAFDARDGKLDCREFGIFAAVLSCIGAKAYPVRITREQVQARMLGYKTRLVMAAALVDRTDGTRPLTVRQVGYTLHRLHELQFFARTRANERQTYYSIRHDQAALEAAVFESKTYRISFGRNRQGREKSLIARIKAVNAIKADSPIKVDNPASEPCLNAVHSSSAAVSQGCPLGVHFKRNPLSRNSGTETLQEKPLSEGALAVVKAVATKLRTA